MTHSFKSAQLKLFPEIRNAFTNRLRRPSKGKRCCITVLKHDPNVIVAFQAFFHKVKIVRASTAIRRNLTIPQRYTFRRSTVEGQKYKISIGTPPPQLERNGRWSRTTAVTSNVNFIARTFRNDGFADALTIAGGPFFVFSKGQRWTRQRCCNTEYNRRQFNISSEHLFYPHVRNSNIFDTRPTILNYSASQFNCEGQFVHSGGMLS